MTEYEREKLLKTLKVELSKILIMEKLVLSNKYFKSALYLLCVRHWCGSGHKYNPLPSLALDFTQIVFSAQKVLYCPFLSTK